MADIPPWLNVQPAQFAQAAEAGARAGLQARIASEQNQRAIEEARLRRMAEEQNKQIRQFELQARINESAARMANADVRNRMAQVQAERQMRADAIGAMAKQAQLDIARQALELKKQQAQREAEPFTPKTMTVDGVRMAQVRPKAWVLAQEKMTPDLNPSQKENLSLGYQRLLRDLNRDQADPLKAMPQDVFEAQKSAYEQKLKMLQSPTPRSNPLTPEGMTPNESNMSLPSVPGEDTESSVQELIYDSKSKQFKPAGQ